MWSRPSTPTPCTTLDPPYNVSPRRGPGRGKVSSEVSGEVGRHDVAGEGSASSSLSGPLASECGQDSMCRSPGTGRWLPVSDDHRGPATAGESSVVGEVCGRDSAGDVGPGTWSPVVRTVPPNDRSGVCVPEVGRDTSTLCRLGSTRRLTYCFTFLTKSLLL